MVFELIYLKMQNIKKFLLLFFILLINSFLCIEINYYSNGAPENEEF